VEVILAKNPYKEGKPLKGNLKGKWRYRFSEYRIIYRIFQDRLIIEIIEVGHRKRIY